jgi:hypothetical protein
MSTTKFDDLLKKFVTATATSKKHALELSIMALEHFSQHGDTVLLQRFFDAMPQNYLRRGALVAWAVNFAPIKVEGQKFVKDQSRKTEAVDLEGAFKKPFWEFKPEEQIWNYSIDDIKTQVLRIVGRARNEAKAAPLDDNAKRMVDRLEAFIEGKGVTTPAEEPANEDGAEEDTGAVAA